MGVGGARVSGPLAPLGGRRREGEKGGRGRRLGFSPNRCPPRPISESEKGSLSEIPSLPSARSENYMWWHAKF